MRRFAPRNRRIDEFPEDGELQMNNFEKIVSLVGALAVVWLIGLGVMELNRANTLAVIKMRYEACANTRGYADDHGMNVCEDLQAKELK